MNETARTERKRARVLVVDDEPRILRFTRLSLAASGYEVITAAKGQEALSLVQSDKPDIMLLDVVLPDTDGLEVLKKLRTFCQIPVIVFSAKTFNADQILSLGANDYIAKPFKPAELLEKIKAILAAKG